MTTSTYLALTLMDKIFTMSDLANSGVHNVLKIGRHLITYTPRSDQPLSLEHTIEAFADKQPANDNDPQEDVSPAAPEPALAQDQNAALIVSMKALETSNNRLISEMAKDWLRNSSLRGANRKGQNILNQVAFIEPKTFQLITNQAVPVLKSSRGRARLKTWQSQQPIPSSIQIAGRPAAQAWLDSHPQPRRLKNSIGA